MTSLFGHEFFNSSVAGRGRRETWNVFPLPRNSDVSPSIWEMTAVGSEENPEVLCKVAMALPIYLMRLRNLDFL
jgi:hypothetical protein